MYVMCQCGQFTYIEICYTRAHIAHGIIVVVVVVADVCARRLNEGKSFGKFMISNT